MTEMEHGDREFLDSLSDHEKRVVLEILREYGVKGNSQINDLIWELDYEVKPVSIGTFLTDPYYLGAETSEKLYDKWKEAISYTIDNRIVELILTGSIGGGKSTAAIVLILRKVYELLCMRNPCSYYTANSLVAGLFSVTMDRATSVEYALLTKVLMESPYFRSQVRFTEKDLLNKRYGSLLDLPKGIKFAFGSRVAHSLGADLVMSFMDEVSFSASAEGKQVLDLYNGVKRRLESRFMSSKGSIPGVTILASSANFEGDFLDDHIKEATGKPGVHVVCYALYDLKHYEGERFRVLVGDKSTTSRVLDTLDAKGEVVRGEDPPEGSRIEYVPVVWYDRYADDVEGALRDISGIAIFSSHPFINDRPKVIAAIDTTRDHPFTMEDPRVSIHSDVTLESMFLKEKLFKLMDPYQVIYRLKHKPDAPRFAHVDLAVRGDSVGLAICHFEGLAQRHHIDNDGKKLVAYYPVIDYDMIVRIPPTPRSSIDFSKIRSFFYYLRDLGMPIKRISYDGWQSEDSLQYLEKAGFETKKISVDLTPAPYLALRSAIMEGRVKYYKYEPFLNELFNLQRVDSKATKMGSGLNVNYKIDHPLNGSKDSSDAAAGALFNCITHDEISSQLDSPHVIVGLKEQVQSVNDAMNPNQVAGWVIGEYDEDLTGII